MTDSSANDSCQHATPHFGNHRSRPGAQRVYGAVVAVGVARQAGADGGGRLELRRFEVGERPVEHRKERSLWAPV